MLFQFGPSQKKPFRGRIGYSVTIGVAQIAVVNLLPCGLAGLLQLRRLIEGGHVRPVVDREVPMDDAAGAHRRVGEEGVEQRGHPVEEGGAGAPERMPPARAQKERAARAKTGGPV